MTEACRVSIPLVPFQLAGDDAQNPLRRAMGAHANLKAARAEPSLVQCPAVTNFAQNLGFVHATVFEQQLAGLGPRDSSDAAHDAISRRAGFNQKASHALAPLSARQARKQLDEIGDIGE